MNIMRKFLSVGSSQEGSMPDGATGGFSGDGEDDIDGRQSDDVFTSRGATAHGNEPRPEQDMLGLSHLKKLYSEYQTPKQGPLSDSEKEERVYMMLPLFCKVFANSSIQGQGQNTSSSKVISQKFSEANHFGRLASRLLVTEVRRRASNQSTEAAAGAIAAYMEVDANESDESSGNGWLLLSTLNILVTEGETMAEVMTSASVPSTLVKCLYLFFDLPELSADTQGEESDSEFSPRERRILLQKMFIQVLLRLCAHIPAVEELADKDDLTLLFSAVTSSCPEHNLMWRKTAADILLTVSRHSLSTHVVSYLHKKGCIALCIDNMQRSSDLKPLEIVEMFVTVFCFLKDSSQDSQTLMDDFRTCQGYTFLSEFLLKLEKVTDNDEVANDAESDKGEANEAIRNLVLLVASLSFCGHQELRPSSIQDVSAISLFQLSSFELPEPENKGSTVRNLHAFQVLQSVFFKSTSVQLGGTIMDAISTIYTADNANYFLLESQHTLPQCAERLASKPHSVQEKFFQLVEFLVHHLRFVPCKELISISLLIKAQQNTECSILAIQTLVSILKFDSTFKDVFREIGTFATIIGYMKSFIAHLKSEQEGTNINSTDDKLKDLGECVLSLLSEIMAGNNQNAGVFRESEGTDLILQLINFPLIRKQALHLLQQLILAGGNEEDMKALLSLLYVQATSNLSVRRTDGNEGAVKDDNSKMEASEGITFEYESRIEVLNAVIFCLKESHKSRTIFRKVGGFVYVISIIMSMEGCLSPKNQILYNRKDEENVFNLLRSVFTCLAVAMRYEPANAHFFNVEVLGFTNMRQGANHGLNFTGHNFVETILKLGCFSSYDISKIQRGYMKEIKPISSKPKDEVIATFDAIFNCDNLSSIDEFYERNATEWKIDNTDTKNAANNAASEASANTSASFVPVNKEFTQNSFSITPSMFSACVLLRMLYDMALDRYNKDRQRNASSRSNATQPRSPIKSTTSSSLETGIGLTSPEGSETNVSGDAPSDSGSQDSAATGSNLKKRSVAKLNLAPSSPEPVIVHAAMITTMLKLMPYLDYQQDENKENGHIWNELSNGLLVEVSTKMQSLLRQEKNQQIMCEAGLMTDIVSIARNPLEDETHIVHTPFQYLLERLAAQKLEPSDLRTFLRLGNPLACLTDKELNAYYKNGGSITNTEITLSKPGGFIPLTRIKTLVSMTTPRDLHIQNNSILPPFIEFDMASEGFGCLFIPSLAPTSPHTAAVVGVSSLASQESAVIGGIGLGDRAFPPQAGLSYSTWFCIDKFCDPRSDPHPVRLLTLARMIKNVGQEEHLVCLAVCLSARDKAFIISTQETPLSKNSDWQPEFVGENGLRVWFPDLIKEGEWHHLVIVLNRQVLKNSSFSLYVNGQHISTQRLSYISQNPGGGAANLTLASSVYGFIGTPPHWRRMSRLCWKQGPCQMFEDVTSPQLAHLLYRLGPHYLGSLQAPQISTTGEVLTSQIAEEKLIFGLNCVAVTQMTLAKIKRVYSKVDNKSIAKQLGMATGENATPIKVVHNSAGHLLGPARSLGGVVIGYLGVRVFRPQPVSKVIETIGGCNVLLGIIAMARDMESLYAGVKALVCVLKSNPFAHYEMDSNKGYQTLAMLLRKKLPLLNAHILHLMFTMAGTVDSAKEVVGIPNIAAFRDILCDLELWHGAPSDIEKSLFEHFFELISDSNSNNSSNNGNSLSSSSQKQGGNIRLLREFNLVEKLLSIMKKPDNNSNNNRASSISILLNVVHGLLCTNPRVTDVLSFALFTAATLMPSTNDEKKVILKSGTDGTEIEDKMENVICGDKEVAMNIVLRNRCLKLFYSLLYFGGEEKQIHVSYCEDVVQVVGFDWIQLFLQGHLHSTTVVWGLRILMTLLSQPVLLQKFRAGSFNGHWLIKSEIVLQNKMVKALGQGSTTATKVTRKGIRKDIFSVPGFQLFNWLMPCHIEIPEIYFLLMAMALGQPNMAQQTLPVAVKFDFDSIWKYIFGTSPAESKPSDLANKVKLSGDTLVTILCMVRTMLNFEANIEGIEQLPQWLKEYPVTLTQFFFYLYHNVNDFMPVFMTTDVLTALAGTLFPSIVFDEISEMASDEGGSNQQSPTRYSREATNQNTQMSFHTKGTNSSPTRDDCCSLTNHPAKRNVMQFMRDLIVDSLPLQVTQKSPPVIDLLLDAQPENTTHAQQCTFQTELLGHVMDRLLAADILIGDQAALPTVPGGNMQYIAPNVFYLASRLVDKMWQGIFKKEPEEVFQFILKLISQTKKRSDGGSFNLESIYRCLNRTILYMLSRPHSTVASQMSVLEVLHKIVDNRNIIFGAGNHELEFFGCLTFCLLQIKNSMVIPTETSKEDTTEGNHTDDEADAGGKTNSEGDINLDHSTAVNKHQGQNLLINASARVWELMYVSKRPALEEVFKCSFGQQNTTPPLELVQGILLESANKIWFNYIDMEKRAVFAKIPAWEFHTQLETRIQRITGGFVKRFTSGGQMNEKATKKEVEQLPRIVYSNIPRLVIEQATLNHIAIVKDVVEQSYKNRLQTEKHMLKYIEEEWLQTEGCLTQERGLWGPYNESSLTKRMLDTTTEGPSRMTKKMIRNDLFYHHYQYKPPEDSSSADDEDADRQMPTTKKSKPASRDSKLWYEQHHTMAMFERDEGAVVELEYDDCDVTMNLTDTTLPIEEQIRSIGFQGLKTALGQATANNENRNNSVEESEEPLSSEASVSVEEKESERGSVSQDDSTTSIPSPDPPQSPQIPLSPPASSSYTSSTFDNVQIEEESSDYQTVMRLLENGEKISQMERCARIQGLDTHEGLLLFGKEYFYILDGFTLVNGREVHDIDLMSTSYYTPIIPTVPGQVNRISGKKQVIKLTYDSVLEVHKRRCLLQPIGLEVFCTNGQNILLAFSKNDRPKAYQKFLSAASASIADNAQLSIAGQKRSANVEQSTGLLSSLMGETSVTQRWVRGEITNFQYLMSLNTLAGRSYNDLMQYPVFPWILADYTSEDLDLNDPSTFRDLSKPMGAQTEHRLKQFKKRYAEWEDPQLETDPYYYGTHYSSAMIVSSYLVRLEPFTQHFLHLQGGHFDLPDRMFHSVEEAWDSASRNNMADLRELIPEFFYLPDFLMNENKFDLGMKQNGERLDDAILPPWAKGSPHEFIRAHREALECDYVSAHLHEWIDLIFGYKQQGIAATEAINTFHPFFYEGNVDIFSITDPLQRNATIGFINNFGQIPKQLFKKAHPPKKLTRSTAATPGVSIDSQTTLPHGVHTNSKIFFHHLTNLKPTMAPIKELKGPVGQIQHCDGRLVYAVEQNKVLVPGNSNRYLAWGFADQSFRLCNYESDKAVFICEPNYLIGQVLTCVCPNPKLVLTAGTSSVVAVYEYHKKVKQLLIKKMLYGHTDAVTCLAASPGWAIAVSGSRDRTAIIWDLSRYTYVKHLSGHVGPVAAVTIDELVGNIVTCAGSWLYLWDINGKPIASINTVTPPTSFPKASSENLNSSSKNLESTQSPRTIHKQKNAQQILCVACSQFQEWDRENVSINSSIFKLPKRI